MFEIAETNRSDAADVAVRPKPSIDREFRDLIPRLSDEERAQLEENLVRDGCLSPLIIWRQESGDILVDGYNRFEICEAKGIKYEVRPVPISDRLAATEWIIRNQFGRRNLNVFQRAELALKLKPVIAARAKENQKVAGGNKSKREKALRQKSAKALDTDKEVGAAAKLSDDTIRKAEKILREASDEVKQALRAGDTSINAEYKKLTVHFGHKSGNSEWYTPPEFIAAAREVMGNIDCDPASSAIANCIVDAEKFYTAEDDSLTQKWSGRVWMNPPYAQPACGQFAKAITEKFTSGEVQQACVLVNNATETAWFQEMLRVAAAVCFPAGRVKFLDPEGNNTGATLHGQAVIYLGRASEKFKKAFQPLGFVLVA